MIAETGALQVVIGVLQVAIGALQVVTGVHQVVALGMMTIHMEVHIVVEMQPFYWAGY